MPDMNDTLGRLEFYAHHTSAPAKAGIFNILLEEVLDKAGQQLTADQSASITDSLAATRYRFISHDLPGTVASFAILGRLLSRGLMATPELVEHVKRLDGILQIQKRYFEPTGEQPSEWSEISLTTKKRILTRLNLILAEDMAIFGNILNDRRQNGIETNDARHLIPVLDIMASLMDENREQKTQFVGFSAILRKASEAPVGSRTGDPGALSYLSLTSDAIARETFDLRRLLPNFGGAPSAQP